MTGPRTTNDLICDLAGLPAPKALSRGLTLGGIGGAAALAVLLFWLAYGLRPDLSSVIGTPSVQAKSLLPLLLAFMALWLAVISMRPDARLRLWPLFLPLLPGASLFVGQLLAGQNGPFLPQVMGRTAAACLASITLLSLPPIAVGLTLMKRGAPTRPELSGALLGLASAGGIAAGYALYCTEDSPLFFVPWYGLAICLAAGIGAFGGRCFLRW